MVTKKPKGLGRGLDALLGPTLASSGEGDAATPAGTPMMLALDAMGETDWAHQQFANMQHLREHDGSYWTGLVYTDGKRWPVERTTWTGAAVILAADALSNTTPGAGIFRAEELPRGLEADFGCDCVVSER